MPAPPPYGYVLFPEDRAAYLTGPRAAPIRSAAGVSLKIYTDISCSTPAMILDYETAQIISTHRLLVGDDSLIPLFYANADAVVAKTEGGRPYYLYPAMEARIQSLESEIHSVTAGGSFIVSDTEPTDHPLAYAWMQTGLGTNGDGMTLWVDDGQ